MTGAERPAARTALVTGANRGIGLETSRQLVERGLTTIVSARDPAAAARAARACGAAGAIQLDVTDPASVRRCAERCRTDFGAVDVLVNNAGVLLDDERRLLEVEEAVLATTLEVNLVGVWRMVRAFVPSMLARGYGRVVNLSTGLSRLSAIETGSPAYSVSKTALNMLTAQLAAELRGTGVLVNCLDPGWVRTDMGGPEAPRTPAEGADTAVFLATLPDDGPTGLLFHDRQPVAW
ncbi:MAG TPA: SDR family NAD(P)-dependent oxidoreductase [Candidatus Micrarchaeia archaeon]|nr:SDR family NAD(P)-dependent oxidoreductase [Candidatus Micrarchaeia archaeon]